MLYLCVCQMAVESSTTNSPFAWECVGLSRVARSRALGFLMTRSLELNICALWFTHIYFKKSLKERITNLIMGVGWEFVCALLVSPTINKIGVFDLIGQRLKNSHLFSFVCPTCCVATAYSAYQSRRSFTTYSNLLNTF